MMDKYLKLTLFYIKKNKWIYVFMTSLVYLIILPTCYFKINDFIIQGIDPRSACYQVMEMFLLVLIVVSQSFLFQVYVEPDMKEIIYVTERYPKYYLIIFNCICIHVVLIPFYFIVNCLAGMMLNWILCFIFQSFVLSVMYYCLSMVCRSSLISLGTMICYCLLFINSQSMVSLFIVDSYIPTYYVIKWISISLICMCLGRKFEKI